jgi:hypothetical protein
MKKLYSCLTLLLTFAGISSLRAQDSTRCNATFQVSVDLNQAFFTAFDSMPGVLHHWNFGDGTSRSTDSSMTTHAYPPYGSYTVTQVVVDSARHCRDSASQIVTIGPNCSVYINFRNDSTGRRYTFVANVVSAPGVVDSVRWTINDTLAGQGDTLRKFLPGGPYTVCAHLRTSSGCENQACVTIDPRDSVPAGPPPPPDTCTIAFGATTVGHSPNQYRFTVADSAKYDSINWSVMLPDSGIATTFSGPAFTYTFRDTGYYTVAVAAKEISGCFVSAAQYIHIDSVGGGSDGFITSYPNPATNQVTLGLKLDSFTDISIRVFNSMGGLTLSRVQSGYPGNNQVTIPVADLPMGVYYIEVQYGNTIRRSKIQKL